ncbi:MAG: malto-oligosyltrehalose trehalohydrolase [Bacteroidota bacterium]|nr:malto-oligosyltrehalose trehalohydrolase [Bacteroidota bacterium]MDP4190046.1 malto-oligosyltrehalose trehalohydrolase [Bacteroidota bacterium]MDP4194950.1 malto-oligosyltrehalose trehalohydrolase [Bacteroidota bacterium]
MKHTGRKLPVGAEILDEGGVHFRVWAPGHKKLEVVIENNSDNSSNFKSENKTVNHFSTNRFKSIEMKSEKSGHFSATVETAGEGTLYRYKIDGADYLYPDPVSRFQPEGPHGPSMVVDPNKFQWTDELWKGISPEGQVIYEMHIGTFTNEGTIKSAMKELEELASLGITVIEIMPLAEFAGKYGWGYDGVDLFAPTHLYGGPDDYRRFIDKAHSLGVGVILDVVYNHFGPDGNYINAYSEDYFTDKYENEWGEAINFDGRNSKGVREFFISNASYWIDEYHFDGLRLDATQQIFDESETNIIAEITLAVRKAAGEKKTYIVSENEPQNVRLVLPFDKGGYGTDSLWNDDLHHSAFVTLTGHNEAYYTDYKGKPQEFISGFKWGYIYQGQYYKWQNKRRGSISFNLRPSNFVTFIQNHDQIANSGHGTRCYQLSSPGKLKAMTALFLLTPGTPMLFQGQEFAAGSPFFYFADHKKTLSEAVRKGRSEFLSQFVSLSTPEMQACLPDPADLKTFERSKLDFSDRERNAPIYKMHKDLLRLRREDPVIKNSQYNRSIDGAILDEEAFVIRFFSDDGLDRLLLINFGTDLHLSPAPEPLLAPPDSMKWETKWSSEFPSYDGCGCPPVETEEDFFIQGQAASLLIPKPILQEKR